MQLLSNKLILLQPPTPPPRCQTPIYFGAWSGSSRPAGEHVASPSDRDLQGPAPPAGGALGDGGRGLGGGGGAWGPRVRTRERPGRCLGRSRTAACAPPRPLPTFLCSGEGVLAAPRPRCAAHPAGAGPGEAPRQGRGGTWAGECGCALGSPGRGRGEERSRGGMGGEMGRSERRPGRGARRGQPGGSAALAACLLPFAR